MECLAGLHLCAQTRTRFSRVYLARIPDSPPDGAVLSPIWDSELRRIRDPERRRTETALRLLLEKALLDALGSRPEYAGLTRDRHGTWHSAVTSISLAATERYCAVGMASEAIGVALSGDGAPIAALCAEAEKRRAAEEKLHPVQTSGASEIFRSEEVPGLTIARAGSGLMTGWYLSERTGFRFLGERMHREERT